MVKPVFKTIYLRDADGGVMPFRSEALQTRLAGAFSACGLAGDAEYAGEIVLALEYTLLKAPRPEAVFSCGEVDSAVIRLLESMGFSEVARVFRRSASEQWVMLSTDQAGILSLLPAHLGCSPERMAHIAALVKTAMSKLDIPEAPPHLILELARYYERELETEDRLPECPAKELLSRPPETTLTKEAIRELLPERPRKMMEAGILKINGVTTLFPGIRFFFYLLPLSRANGWRPPVTELEIEPALYGCASALEEARRAIAAALAMPEEPPCCLALPDMFDFLSDSLDCPCGETLAMEFAAILTSAFPSEVYKLTFD